GLVLSTDSSIIRGLVINRFRGSQLHIKGGFFSTISGNFLGTDYTGRIALNVAAYGILIDQAAQKNIIGGTTPQARNVISGSGNGLAEVRITDFATIHNTVEGNYLGVDVTGTTVLRDTAGLQDYVGVVIDGEASSNHIGGTAAGTGNVIGD